MNEHAAQGSDHAFRGHRNFRLVDLPRRPLRVSVHKSWQRSPAQGHMSCASPLSVNSQAAATAFFSHMVLPALKNILGIFGPNTVSGRS